MGFFSKLGAALGVGGARIDIVVPTNTVSPGTALRGSVVITCGKDAQVMNRLLLELRQRLYVVETVVYRDWHGFDYSEYPVQEESVVWVTEFGHGHRVGAGEQVEWPFELDIPPDTTPTQFGLEYGLVARADIPNQPDPVSALPLEIVPAAAVPAGPPSTAPPRAPGGAPFNQGARINAVWTDGNWYPATIGQHDPAGGGYYVHWDDGSEGWVPPGAVRVMPMPLAPGTRVNAPWEDDYYPAQILHAQEGQYLVRWQADGEESWVPADLVEPA